MINRLFLGFVVPCLILIVFFHKVLFGLVPFPADLLLAHYEPYSSYSYDGYAPGGMPSKDQGSDVVREMYPWKYFSIDQVKKGIFPFWNPYTFSGNPHFAALQGGLFYPVNIVFFVFPFISGWSIYIVLQYLFLLIFSYLYLKTIKVGNLGSLFGATAISFSGFMVVWGEFGTFGHALEFLPLLLICIEKFLESKKFRWAFLMTAALLLSIFAGYIQITLYVFLLSSTYSVFRVFSGKLPLHRLLIIIFFFLITFFIAALQLLPLFEFVNLSLRVPYTFLELAGRLTPISNIITLLVPDFFGNPATRNYFISGSIIERAAFIGTWPLIFAVYAAINKKTFYSIFFTFATVLTYISTFAILPIIYIHSLGIPLLSTGVPTRILCIFCFSAAMLAGIGINDFIKNYNKSRLYKVIFVFGFVFALLYISTYFNVNPNSLISRRNIIVPAVSFAIGVFILIVSYVVSRLKTKKINKTKISSFALVFIFILTIFELNYYFQKFNTFVPAGNIYPKAGIIEKIKKIQGIDRYWGYGSALIEPNLQLQERNFTPEGYDALYIKRYGEFISGSKAGKLEAEISHTNARIFPGYGPSELKGNPYRARALNILGVKYLLNKKSTPGVDSAFDEKDYKLISEMDGFQIYQNLNVLPRISIYGNYVVLQDKKLEIAKIYEKNFDPKKTLILEEKIPSYNIQEGDVAKVSNIKYSTNEVLFTTETQKDSLVFISDNYYPGWKASVDGVVTPIYIADYTFRAIPVHSGTHNVKLYFDPKSFDIGLIISSVSGLLLILLGFIIIKRHEF